MLREVEVCAKGGGKAGAEPCGQVRDGKTHAAKHISKSKCTKHTMPGALFEVVMSKKCKPLRRKTHFELKSVKN